MVVQYFKHMIILHNMLSKNGRLRKMSINRDKIPVNEIAISFLPRCCDKKRALHGLVTSEAMDRGLH